MTENELSASSALVERYSYDDRTVLAVDLGPGADPAVDVVDDTAILVFEDEQREIDLPSEAVKAVNSNGVVTFEVRE